MAVPEPETQEMDIDPALSLPPSLEDCDLEESPIPFEGDYYGDYPDGFFVDSPTLPVESPSSESSEDEEDDFLAPLQHSWEPAPRPCDTPQSPTTPIEYPQSDVPGPPLPTTEQRAAIEKNTHRNAFVVKFPSAHAGAPIPNAAPSSPAYKLYSNALRSDNGTSEANFYYPFASERDWKIARWAKLRGPGSTALDELLAIEEVSLFILTFRISASRRSTGCCTAGTPWYLSGARPHPQQGQP